MSHGSCMQIIELKNNWNVTWGGKFEAKILEESPGPRKKNTRGRAKNTNKRAMEN